MLLVCAVLAETLPCLLRNKQDGLFDCLINNNSYNMLSPCSQSQSTDTLPKSFSQRQLALGRAAAAITSEIISVAAGAMQRAQAPAKAPAGGQGALFQHNSSIDFACKTLQNLQQFCALQGHKHIVLLLTVCKS